MGLSVIGILLLTACGSGSSGSSNDELIDYDGHYSLHVQATIPVSTENVSGCDYYFAGTMDVENSIISGTIMSGPNIILGTQTVKGEITPSGYVSGEIYFGDTKSAKFSGQATENNASGEWTSLQMGGCTGWWIAEKL